MSEFTLQRSELESSTVDFAGSGEALIELEELKGLRKASSLRLQFNYGVNVLSHACQYLHNLKSLHIYNSSLPSLRFLGSSFPKVKELSIVNCHLKNLDGVTSFPNLEILRVPGNEICNVDYCIYLSNLSHLDVERNLIGNLKSLEWLVLCNKLVSLILLNNPLYISNSSKPPSCTEAEVLELLPQLKYIDGRVIDSTVQKIGKFLRWWSPYLPKQVKGGLSEKFSRISLDIDSDTRSMSSMSEGKSLKKSVRSTLNIHCCMFQ